MKESLPASDDGMTLYTGIRTTFPGLGVPDPAQLAFEKFSSKESLPASDDGMSLRTGIHTTFRRAGQQGTYPAERG